MNGDTQIYNRYNSDNTASKSNNQRILYIDYAKAIGIFLVVLGHQSITKGLITIIYTFHMPLFFFISGYLFMFKKYASYKVFLQKKINQLLIPYLVFNIITYIFWLFVGRKFGADAAVHISPITPLVGILYGNGKDLVHCTTLWFLLCLFITENIYFLLFKGKKLFVAVCLLIMFFVLGYFDYTLSIIRLPWSINLSLVAVVFYGAGQLLKQKLYQMTALPLAIQIFILICSFLICLYVGLLNHRIDMNGRDYQNYFLFFLAAFGGILFILLLSKLLEFVFGEIKAVSYISKNTIIIMAFHIIALSVIKGFFVYVLKQPLSVFDNNNLLCFLATIIVLLLLVPVMYIINKYSSLNGSRVSTAVRGDLVSKRV